MSGSKGEVLDVFEADLLSYLLEGQQPHPTGTHYSYEIIQEYALKAEQVICQRMSDYKFSWSQELDCCSQFHDLEFVSQNLFSLYELAKIFGDKLSQPWMVAQSCGLWAAKHKKYKFWFGDKIVESMYSWPCIFGNDNRLIVPCIYENRAVFVVSDEYWAFPSGVIDFKSQKWFSKHTSPLMRANTFEQFTASCVRNIAVWYFLIRYSPVIEYKRQNIVNSPYIYIGGAPNPSHIIWNYLGGISFAANASPELVNVEIVQSTDMLFSLQSIGLSSTDLSGRSEFDRIKYLVNCGYGSSLALKFTDIGVNPQFCESIYHKIVAQNLSINVQQRLGSVPLLAGSVNSSEVSGDTCILRIGLSVRSGKRKIVNQAAFFFHLLELIAPSFSQIEVFVDGSSAGGWNSVNNDTEIASDLTKLILASWSNSHTKISIKSCIGMTIEEQVCIYRNLHTYLTYVSGGNAKIIPFCNSCGLAVGPRSEVTSSNSVSLSEACKATRLSEDIASQCFLADTRFLVSHDYIGHADKLVPPVLYEGEEAVNSNDTISQDAFNSDFQLDPLHAKDLLLSCIKYNTLS